jgi:tetratricopeptide (TPR) repeat protein
VITVASWPSFAADSLEKAKSAMQAGEADRAMSVLDSMPASAEVHYLKCRVFYSLEQWDAAENECQQSVSLDIQNSDYHMWLGRALGSKADRSSFMSAFSLAKRTRSEFEEAVRLDGRNAAALADLGEFDYTAPGVVGGGVEKADAIALQLDRVDPERAHELRGRIAETRKDFDMAESELKRAIAVSPHPAYRWITLANFYRRRQRWTDMDTAMQTGLKGAHSDAQACPALFNGASTLATANRNLPLAAKTFHDYLACASKSEEAPAFVAYTRLATVEAKLGDPASAHRDRAAALELAHSYRPALDLKY